MVDKKVDMSNARVTDKGMEFYKSMVGDRGSEFVKWLKNNIKNPKYRGMEFEAIRDEYDKEIKRKLN
jgi:hypothetical protein